MPIELRPITRDDEPFLWDMLYEALYVPPGDPELPRSVLDRPDLGRYAFQFGKLEGDHGWIAEDSTRQLGAAWVRQGSEEDPGYGFIDAATPELSIAVVPDRRGTGIGTLLLQQLLRDVPRCSLSVHKSNPAVRLYERAGFEVVEQNGQSITMLRRGRKPE